MALFPEVVTHNYDPDRGAFRNICAVPDREAEAVLESIRASGKRRIKATYLQRRRAVETWLSRERGRMLGSTALQYPLYFFLGDFADGRDRSRPLSHVLPISAFPPDTLTFTYSDSMESFAIATRDDHMADRKPYHGRVFTLSEIKEVVSQFGLPEQSSQTSPPTRYDRFIEAQVWDDAPINARLGCRATPGPEGARQTV